MSKKRVSVYNDRGGWMGKIPDEETYEKVKQGKADWEDRLKANMISVRIPVALFYRLMALDKAQDELNAETSKED